MFFKMSADVSKKERDENLRNDYQLINQAHSRHRRLNKPE
jgi:hypothetical protein